MTGKLGSSLPAVLCQIESIGKSVSRPDAFSMDDMRAVTDELRKAADAVEKEMRWLKSMDESFDRAIAKFGWKVPE